MAILQLLYVSTAVAEVHTEEHLHEIVEKAQAQNRNFEITGLLMTRAGLYLQLLEGPKDHVLRLFETIKKDPRHKDIKKIFAIESNDRLFHDWSMGYRKLDELDLSMISEVLNWSHLISAAKELDNILILQMLSRFKGRFRDLRP